MTKGMILRYIITLLLGGSMLVPVLVSAQVGQLGAQVNTAAQVNTPVGNTAAGVSASAALDAKAKKAQERGDQEIDRRLQSLSDLNTRINNMQRVTASFKQSLSTNIQGQITGLTQLKAKIDADTDTTTLKTDIQSVTKSYRIFALVLPMSRIAAAADREVTIITMMNQLGAKLQARISAAQTAGSDTSTLLSTLTDLSTKLSDASTQAQAAVSASASLTPDNGDATKMAQNTTALKTARGDIQASQKDLVAARKDIKTIITGLGQLKPATTGASSTAQVGAGTQ